MELQPYLPVILFILVGVAVGVVPQVLGIHPCLQTKTTAIDSVYTLLESLIFFIWAIASPSSTS